MKPFQLAIGIKADIPIKVGLPSFRVANFNPAHNYQKLQASLDVIHEVRDEAVYKEEKYKRIAAQYCNHRVYVKRFQVRDLALKRAELVEYIQESSILLGKDLTK